MWRRVGTIGVLLVVFAGGVQASDTQLDLDPIEVTAPGLIRDQLDTPAAISVVEAPELQTARQRLALDETLNRVPGVFFQNRYNFAQNLRFRSAVLARGRLSACAGSGFALTVSRRRCRTGNPRWIPSTWKPSSRWRCYGAILGALRQCGWWRARCTDPLG